MTPVMAPQMGMMPGGVSLARSSGFSGMDGMLLQTPPAPGSPMSGAAVGSGSFNQTCPNQIQQKMARQRQLALERRRMAGRHAAGGMAQANQLPAPTMASMHAKAPGWDRAFGENIEKPGSLAEKAEAAFHDGKRHATMVKAVSSSLKPVDEKGEQHNESTAGRMKDKRPSLHKRESIEEIEIGVIELDLSTNNLGSEHPSHPGKELGGIDASKGWSLHVEETFVAPQSSATSVQRVQELQPGSAEAREARRWYKPSTWQRKSAPAHTGSIGAIEVTHVSSFDRAGLTTPDSTSSGPTWGGSSGRRRRPIASPSYGRSSPAIEVDFGFVDCPGSVLDSPHASMSSPPPVGKADQHNRRSLASGGRKDSRPMGTLDLEPSRPAAGRASSSQSSLAPFPPGEHTDEVVEAVISETGSEADNRPPSQVAAQVARPTRPEPSWSSQAEDPKHEKNDERGRRRFWKPFASPRPAASPAVSPPTTVETTMVSAFGND